MYYNFFSRARIVFITIYFSLFANLLQSQTNTLPSIGSVIPVSPNAASLAKYGEVPVGYATGIPNINIPVYEINSGSLKMPINLSYHAGGVRVEEIASWVGLGWSLNAGGVITRQVRGLADESGNGYLYHSGDISDYINNAMNSTQKQAYQDDITDGNIDSQPDIYIYNLGGESGKFFLKPNGDVLTIPYTKNRISGGSAGWIITDVNGNTYYFNAQETTTTTPMTGSISSSAYIPVINAWYLTKIVNAVRTDSITITYESTYTQMNTGISQTKYVFTGTDASCTSKEPENSFAYSTTFGKRIAKINFKNGTIRFNKSASSRKDFMGDYALESIEIYNADNTFYKKLQLYQSYVAGNGVTYGTAEDEINRMYLDSVKVFDNGSKIEHYNLTYNQSEALPSRKSFSQDHWGYYNGVENGYNFVPTTNITVSGSSDIVVTGADRNPDTLANQVGILKTIQYPTGGKTEFEYETNKVSNLQDNQAITIEYGYFSIGYILGTNTYAADFEIPGFFSGTPDSTNNVTITINNGGGGCSIGASLDCPLVYLSGPGGYGGSIIMGSTISLRKGTYHLNVDLTGVTDPEKLNNFYVQFTWLKRAQSNPNYQYNVPVAGLRIKKIINFSANGVKANVKQYSYNIPDSVNYSSGYLLSFPKYVGKIMIHKIDVIASTSTKIYSDCPYVTLSSTSNYPLQTTQGSYVGYKYVQELLGEDGKFGKNEYTFTAPDSYPDTLNTSFPFAPATSVDWKRGQLLKSKNFRYNSPTNSYVLIQERICVYEDFESSSIMGLKVGQKEFFQGYSPGFTRVYDVGQFTTSSGWFRLKGDTLRTYAQDNSSNYIQTVTNYAYGFKHYQPIILSATNSKGEAVITNMKYPSDYESLTGSDALTSGIRNLQNLNVLSPVIEKYSQIGGDSRVTQSTLTSFKTFSPLPDTIFTTELNKASTSFVPSTVSGGRIVKTNLYTPQLTINKYDANSNISEQQKIKDSKHSYLWDYNAMYPIAEVTNADSVSIAYTSFEADGFGNWSGISGSNIYIGTSATGRKYYTLSGNILQKTGLSSGSTYIVSYWSNTGNYYTVSGTVLSSKKGMTINGWTYCEHEVTGTSTINLSGMGNIDEVRLYPKGALMVTRTYVPLSGVSSECDAGNKIVYYEYDSLGRLLLIRDQDKKIIKSFEYKLQ